ncbi:MAG: type II toxin-antitoxin system VapC family toxin [Desulfobacteraceae bacterium]|nr:type II toxin-antitoxin system VapC family toxin [Desulfobacteraceae bacterium]
MYLSDTNACICIIKKSSSFLINRLKQTDCNDIKLCSVVKAELIYGAYHSGYAEKNTNLLSKFFAPFECFPFDDDCAEEYGRIRSNLSSRGLLIGPNDLMIAAIAKANDLVVITHNTNEFNRVHGLKVEDWQSETS